MNQLRLLTTVIWGLYWLALFVGTHMPVSKSLVASNDKVLHFFAYAGLAGLTTLSVALWSRKGLAARHVVAIVVGLAAFGAFDELTQPLVNRHADWQDWFADVAGVFVGAFSGVVVYWSARVWLPGTVVGSPAEVTAE